MLNGIYPGLAIRDKMLEIASVGLKNRYRSYKKHWGTINQEIMSQMIFRVSMSRVAALI